MIGTARFEIDLEYWMERIICCRGFLISKINS